MKHKFTSDQCRKGGKSRAKQAARQRIATPTARELEVREAIKMLSPAVIEFEKPIQTKPDLEQYADIYAEISGSRVIIEVDGSNGWHDGMKMLPYDEIKAAWAAQNGIALINVPKSIEAEHIPAFIQSRLDHPMPF